MDRPAWRLTRLRRSRVLPPLSRGRHRSMNEWDVIARTVAALLAGGAIGLERSFHGRAAGLRTYALVCFGSALLVAAAQYEFIAARARRGEVTRVIQGIVTGIGFLGAGVIVKEGFSVRGLTTAASIWVASAIGVVIGAGSYLTGAEASVVTLVALALLRHLEDRLPAQSYVHVDVAFDRSPAMDEDRFRRTDRAPRIQDGRACISSVRRPARTSNIARSSGRAARRRSARWRRRCSRNRKCWNSPSHRRTTDDVTCNATSGCCASGYTSTSCDEKASAASLGRALDRQACGSAKLQKG